MNWPSVFLIVKNKMSYDMKRLNINYVKDFINYLVNLIRQKTKIYFEVSRHHIITP